MYIPSLSSIPTTMVRVVPSGTIPVTGLAHGPFPCWISIQQSTLSPEKISEISNLFSGHIGKITKHGSVQLINQVFCFCRRLAIFVFWRFMNFLTWFTKCMSNTLCGWTFRWIVVDLIFCVSWTSFDLLMFHLICQVCLEMKILIFLFRPSRPSASIPIVNQGRNGFFYSLQNNLSSDQSKGVVNYNCSDLLTFCYENKKSRFTLQIFPLLLMFCLTDVLIFKDSKNLKVIS